MPSHQASTKDPPDYEIGYPLDVLVDQRVSPQNKERKTKRILTLDGGGVRGALTLGILRHVEETLGAQWAHETNQPATSFRLWHYFDLIVGTSTGAIIATLLSAGLKVSDIVELYKSLTGEVFPKVPGEIKLLTTVGGVFDSQKIVELLNRELRRIKGWPNWDCALEKAPLKTGLGLVLRRIDTDHTWFAHNNPRAKFYKDNSTMPLTKLVRASTAAPLYFAPQEISWRSKPAAFIDGGVSAFNNPSLAAFIIATLKQKEEDENGKWIPRGFGWQSGDEKLLLLSVGTGWLKKRRDAGSLTNKKGELAIARLREPIMNAFMGDANFLTQGMLLWMSDSKTKRRVHGAAGDLSGEFLFPSLPGQSQRHFLTYLRYDIPLHDIDSYPESYHKKPDFEELKESYYNFVDAGNVNDLLVIGNHIGQRDVKKGHFPSPGFVPEFWPKKISASP